MRSCFRGVCLGDPWVGIPDKEKEQDKLFTIFLFCNMFLSAPLLTHSR